MGLKQHLKKIQVWGLGDSVEHLGVVATMIDPFQPVSLRDGWPRVLELFSLLPRLPGGLVSIPACSVRAARPAIARLQLQVVAWHGCLRLFDALPHSLEHRLSMRACSWSSGPDSGFS